MRSCGDCHYIPWPCPSCGVPRCWCREQDVYRHFRPVVEKPPEPIVLPPSKFKCGHPVELWNVMRVGQRGSHCRTCHNDYMRVYQRRRRVG